MVKRKRKIKGKSTKWLKKNWLPVIILLVTIGGIVLLYFAFPNIIKQFQFRGNTDFDRLQPGNCTSELNKRTMCMGETVSGTIEDGRNANCQIGVNYNSGIWTSLGVVKTNSVGTYTQTQTLTPPGEYIFASICIDTYNVTCRTNNAYLTVNPCPGPGDSDGDGFSDAEEEEAGTDLNDPYDFPEDGFGEDIITYTCGQESDVDNCQGTCPTDYQCGDIYFNDYTACTCVTSDGSNEVHPDWKPEGTYHNPMNEEPPNGGDFYPDDPYVPEIYEQGDCDGITDYYDYSGWSWSGYESCSSIAANACGGSEFVVDVFQTNECCIWDCTPCGVMLTWSGNNIDGVTPFANAWRIDVQNPGVIDKIEYSLYGTSTQWVSNPGEQCLDYMAKYFEDTQAEIYIEGYESSTLIWEGYWWVTPNYF